LCAPAGRSSRTSGVAFRPASLLVWDAEDGAVSYNVYRVIDVPGSAPVEGWSCFALGVAGTWSPVTDDPLPGEVWWLQVVGVFGDGEGSMGTGSACQPRVTAVACS
jgi:hypothetical protein